MALSSGQSILPHPGGEDSCVRVVHTRPGRCIFTEDGEPDAWIATDLVVSLDSVQSTS